MKILFISEHSHTEIGGIAQHIRSIGNVLREEDHVVEYLNAKELSRYQVFDKQLISKKIIKQRILTIAPDIVHVHGFSSFLVYQCLMLTKRVLPDVTLIYTPHYHPFEFHSKPLLAFLFFHVFLKKSLVYVDCLIALTEGEKDFFTPFLSERQIKILPNGIQNHMGLIEKKKPIQHSILFIGRDDDNKRMDFLESQREYFESQAIKCYMVTNKPKVSDKNFTYYSSLKMDQLEKLYQECSVLVVPSKYEAFSLVALEAMSYGMPILISDHVQIKYYLDRGERFNQVFNYNDKIDFIDKLETVLGLSPDVYRQFAKKNIGFTKLFSWDAIVTKLLCIYRELEKKREGRHHD